VTAGKGLVRFNVRLQPRSSRSGVEGIHGDALRVRVHAPPVEGAANEALVAVLAEALGVARSAIRVVAGATSRNKVVEVTGVTAEAVLALAG
jgi:uncharacterized protein (TIGR00251 family)